MWFATPVGEGLCVFGIQLNGEKGVSGFTFICAFYEELYWFIDVLPLLVHLVGRKYQSDILFIESENDGYLNVWRWCTIGVGIIFDLEL